MIDLRRVWRIVVRLFVLYNLLWSALSFLLTSSFLVLAIPKQPLAGEISIKNHHNTYQKGWLEISKSSLSLHKDEWEIPGSLCKPTSSSPTNYIVSSEVGVSNSSNSLTSIICPIPSTDIKSPLDMTSPALSINIQFINTIEKEQQITCTLIETLFSTVVSGFTKQSFLSGLTKVDFGWQSISKTTENSSLNVQCDLSYGIDLHSIKLSYPQKIAYDFTEIDDRFQEFLDETDDTQGVSYTIVDAELGTIHEAAFGDHELDLIAMLASTSKVPSAMLLMAIDEDPAINFSVSEEIQDYIPWEGIYGDRTTIQLLSNTSGIPGLDSLANYDLHLCQFQPFGTLEECGKLIYQNELKGTLPAGSMYDYGGSQWQLAGLVAEQVTGKSWKQIVHHYLAEPCALEVFEYGNMWSSLGAWDGNLDSLRGQRNPHIGGGAISNMRDYAKILISHLRGGWCGGNRILSIDGIKQLQTNRTKEFRRNYGMGWRISYSSDKTPYLYWDPGAFGAVAWIDTLRGVGGYMAIDDYDTSSSSAAINLLLFEVIPLIESAIDRARAKSP